MRKIIKVMVLAALTGSVAWAQQAPVPTPAPLPYVSHAVPAFQASPKSPVSDITGRFGTDVDDYLGVTSWSGIEFDSVYLFLGGATGVRANGVQGGLATRLAGNYLALYYNGTIAEGGGINNGASESSLHSAESRLDWNNSFAFLFGSEAIGGIRLDILINGLSGSQETGSDITESWGGFDNNYNDPHQLVTTVQWGKSLGFLTPKVMLGFVWPENYTQESPIGTVKYKTNSTLGLTIGVDIGDLGIENRLAINLGTTYEAPNNGGGSQSGWWDDQLNVGYGLTLDLGEKFQFKLRPSLTLRLAGNSHKMTPDQGDAYNTTHPQFWFGITPDVELALKFQRSERLTFYTGVKLVFLDFLAEFDSSYTGAGRVENKDEPSSWRLNPLTFSTDLAFAATFKFSDALSLEASISSDLLSLGVPGSSNGVFSLKNPFNPNAGVNSLISAASLVLNVKF